jgi:hypothetical protein
MASSLKLSELPSSSTLNSSDIFLVADIENSQSKTISFGDLNSFLSFQSLSGYDSYQADMEEVNSDITSITGTFSDGNFRSLGDLHNLISQNADLETSRYTSVSNLIDTLDSRVTSDLITNASNIGALVNRLAELEDMQFQAGLATGYLYAQNVTVGEN